MEPAQEIVPASLTMAFSNPALHLTSEDDQRGVDMVMNMRLNYFVLWTIPDLKLSLSKPEQGETNAPVVPVHPFHYLSGIENPPP